MIGLLHPPMGMVLFVLARVARHVARANDRWPILPWLVPLLVTPGPDHLRAGDLALAAEPVLSANEPRAPDRARRDPAGRPAAQGGAHRRHPVVRHAGDADRAHHLRRRRAWAPAIRTRSAPGGSSVVALLRDHLAPRLIGRDAHEIEAMWKDLFFAHARHRRRRHHQPRAGRDRHRAVGPAVPARRAAAVEARGRRAAAGAGLHDRGRLAAPSDRSSSSTSRWPRKAAGLPRRQGQGRQALDRRGRRAPRGRARGGRRRVRADGRRQPGVHGARGVPPRARLSTISTSAGSRSRLPAEDLGGHVELAAQATMPDRGRRIALPPVALPRVPRAAAPARSCRSTARRIGGITPWLKVAHLAETFNVAGLPAFPDGAARVAGGRGAERRMGGVHSAARRRHHLAPGDRGRLRRSASGPPGLGIEWDFDAHRARYAVARHAVT